MLARLPLGVSLLYTSICDRPGICTCRARRLLIDSKKLKSKSGCTETGQIPCQSSIHSKTSREFRSCSFLNWRITGPGIRATPQFGGASKKPGVRCVLSRVVGSVDHGWAWWSHESRTAPKWAEAEIQHRCSRQKNCDHTVLFVQSKYSPWKFITEVSFGFDIGLMLQKFRLHLLS